MCVAYFFFSFFFSFLYKRIFIAFIFFFLLETEQGTQAHTDSDGGRSPQREEAVRMPDPGARHEARSGGPGMGAHEGSRTGTTRDKARHREGKAALGAPPRGAEHPMARGGDQAAHGGHDDMLEHDAGWS